MLCSFHGSEDHMTLFDLLAWSVSIETKNFLLSPLPPYLINIRMRSQSQLSLLSLMRLTFFDACFHFSCVECATVTVIPF